MTILSRLKFKLRLKRTSKYSLAIVLACNSLVTIVGTEQAFAGTFGGGIRYKLNKKMDLNAQLNWQFFLSDSVDGLKANVIENKDNEWLINFQVGVIYHLNYY